MKPKYLEFCGINSFSEPAKIDFEKLLQSGIFGIFGDTGSGKTTILDAIVWAGIAPSKGQAKTLIAQGGISLNDNKIEEIYESSVYPGLDGYGNISLNSKLEVPVLHGGFNYYPEKDKNDKSNSIRIPEIQVYFI